MRFSFFNPDQVRLLAENENEVLLLTRMVENRDTCSYRVSAFEFDFGANPQPGSKPVKSLDMRLSWNATIDSAGRTRDGENDSKVRGQESEASLLRTRQQESEVRSRGR